MGSVLLNRGCPVPLGYTGTCLETVLIIGTGRESTEPLPSSGWKPGRLLSIPATHSTAPPQIIIWPQIMVSGLRDPTGMFTVLAASEMHFLKIKKKIF